MRIAWPVGPKTTEWGKGIWIWTHFPKFRMDWAHILSLTNPCFNRCSSTGGPVCETRNLALGLSDTSSTGSLASGPSRAAPSPGGPSSSSAGPGVPPSSSSSASSRPAPCLPAFPLPPPSPTSPPPPPARQEAPLLPLMKPLPATPLEGSPTPSPLHSRPLPSSPPTSLPRWDRAPA